MLFTVVYDTITNYNDAIIIIITLDGRVCVTRPDQSRANLETNGHSLS